MTDRIDILVSARNQTSGALNQVKQDLSGLDSFASKLNAGLSGIGAIAGAGAIVASLQQIGAEMDALARRGAVFDQLGDVFEGMAAKVGSSSEEMLGAMKKAAQGTISEYDLILTANRAIQFQVADTAEEMAQLIELATALGRSQGVSDSFAVESLVTGIARESPRWLDNIGLLIDLDEATAAYAQTLGKSAEELTTSERKAALLAEAYRQGEAAIAVNKAAVDSSATQYERFDANLQDVKDTFGKFLADLATPLLKDMANDLERLNDAMNVTATERAQNQMQALGTEIGNTAERIQSLQAIQSGASVIGDMGGADAAAGKLKEVQAQVEALGVAYNRQAVIAKTPLLDIAQLRDGVVAFESEEQAALRAAQALEANADSSRTAAMEAQNLKFAALDGADGLSTLESMAWSTAGSLDAVAQAMGRASGVQNRLGAIRQGAINQAQNLALRAVQAGADPAQVTAMYGEMADKLGNVSLNWDATNEATLENKLALEGVSSEYNNVLEGIIEADKAAQKVARSTGGISEEARKAQQAFDELTGKVSGVLSDSLNLDVGVNVDDILPREDAINENARRLADVAVKGYESPWYEYFRNQFPALFQEYFAGAADGDGVKMQAAQLVKNFQDGLEPELLDKDKAKDRVRRLLLGEQSMAQLAQEIASELSAEFGGSISLGKIQATAQSALGVDGGNQVQLAQSLTGVATEATGQAAVIGGNIRSGIVSALDGIGETVAIALDKQFRAENNLKVVTEAGRTNGEAWGSGFLSTMDSLTSQVLEKLAGLVSPYVEATQARNATLNGAN